MTLHQRVCNAYYGRVNTLQARLHDQSFIAINRAVLQCLQICLFQCLIDNFRNFVLENT